MKSQNRMKKKSKVPAFFSIIFLSIILFGVSSFATYLFSYYHEGDYCKIGFPFMYYLEFQSYGSDFKNFGWFPYELIYDGLISTLAAAIVVLFIKLFKKHKDSISHP